MSTSAQKMFDLSRKEASEILNVSTRTLDRYITKKVLPTKNIAGRIFLNRDDIIEFAKQKRKHKGIARRPQSKSQPVYVHQVEPEESTRDQDVDIISATEEKVYKKLYEELRSDLQSFQQRLEGANYRVGQLESELKASVPLLDHQKLLTGHKKERYNKNILYVLLGIILALQPFWLIFVLF
jgi:predicted site-specific integrase-resolvase